MVPDRNEPSLPPLDILHRIPRTPGVGILRIEIYPGVIRSTIHAAIRSALAITALLPGINLRNITFEEENKRGSLHNDKQEMDRFTMRESGECYVFDDDRIWHMLTPVAVLEGNQYAYRDTLAFDMLPEGWEPMK